MSSNLETLNKSFEKNFYSIFQKPELVKSYLNERSEEFDRTIKEAFLKFQLGDHFALVALGGYGRNELFPSSDIDLSIVQLTNQTNKIEELKEFIAWLWTLKVKVGHSVRSIKDIDKVTKSDLKEFTSYLSHRVIFCPSSHSKTLSIGLQKLSKNWIKTKFSKAKKLEQIERFKSYNSTEFNLEPDLKESPGCLRDFQTALWILEHCFEINTLLDCVSLDLFSRKEILNVQKSYNHMQSLRFILNLNAASNRMSFENQLLLAKKSRFKSSKSSSDVEKFMRVFFQHAANLSDFNEMIFQAYEDRLIFLKRSYAKNYYISKDRLGIQASVNLVKKPELILESFLHIGRLKKINGLDFYSMRKIKEAIPKINPSFFMGVHAGNQFIEILKAETSLSTILKKLKQLGLMRLIIPEFGEIEGQMQFDMFHVYTVDEHTFKVVRNMRQMQIGKVDTSMSIEHELINKLPKIELLYLAGIFHDLGKGKGGDHSEIGSTIVTKFCKRLNFSINDTELLGWLVTNHLVMSSISQKTDVHDPQTIINFTTIVSSLEKLNYIYMLTVNDIMGTNPTLWNSWKHDLLKQLFLSSRRKLNLDEPGTNTSVVKERKALSIEPLEKTNRELVLSIWDQLPETYFAKHQLEQLQNQADALANSQLKTAISLTKRKNLIEIFIFTPNHPGLFLKTASILERLSLETIDANIHTTNDDKFAMNTFICKHKVLGGNLNQRDQVEIKKKIIAYLSLSESIPLTKNQKVSRKKVFQYTTRAEITSLATQNAQLVTLETLDQPALLSKVANIFLEHGISIFSARITTLGEKVEDNFIVMDEKKKTKISESKKNLVIKKLKKL